MKQNPAAIIVFARQPVPGRVKTRLGRAIGAIGACEVYADLLRTTLEVASGVNARRFLFLPDGDRLDPTLFPTEGFEARVQVGTDLGERMEHAFRDLFTEGFQRILLMGSDCPYLTPAMLADALARLAHADTVFVPATDGGYVLVGQRAPARDLFTGIPWSTADVWRRTRQRLAERGWSCDVLPALEDIDVVEALARWRKRGTGV